jgi:DNA-binding beta-propeller fold protein YncE
MHQWPTLLAMALFGAASASAAGLSGPVKIAVEKFVSLPSDVRHPEGLTSNPANGDLYVGTFDAREPASARNNQILRYSADGKLLARYGFGPQPLTGLEFADGKLYILNFGASKLQRLAANFTADSALEDIASFGALAPTAPAPRAIANPDGSTDQLTFGSGGFAAINGMVFDPSKNLYISDSFQGAIYRIDSATRCSPCTVKTVSRDPLLATAGYLPFGANGLAFATAPDKLYVTNAGDSRLLRLDLVSGLVSVLSESLPGADGLLFHDGLLWVSANQADVVLGIDEQGLIRAKAGEFQGLTPEGSPRGLLFPASTAVSGKWMVVTNLALPLTPASGDEWEERVTRWNLVRFKLPRSPHP